jgi:hypothetical protein
VNGTASRSPQPSVRRPSWRARGSFQLPDAARLQSVAPDGWQAYFEVTAADYLGLRQKGGNPIPSTALNISSARSDESHRESVDPFPHVGEVRDFLTFRETRRAAQRAALNQLTEEAGEAGLYERSPDDYASALKSVRKRRASGAV